MAKISETKLGQGSQSREAAVPACLLAQSCPTLRDLRDYSSPGSSVHGLFQARILEWVAIPFSKGSSPPRDRTQVSCIAGRYFTTEPPGKLPEKPKGSGKSDIWPVLFITGLQKNPLCIRMKNLSFVIKTQHSTLTLSFPLCLRGVSDELYAALGVKLAVQQD